MKETVHQFPERNREAQNAIYVNLFVKPWNHFESKSQEVPPVAATNSPEEVPVEFPWTHPRWIGSQWENDTQQIPVVGAVVICRIL